MLVYGYDPQNNCSVHVRDANNGLACSCICPICKSALVAQQGAIRDWHFRHHSTAECSGALETMLHLRAKEILSKTRYLNLPFLDIHEQATLSDGTLVSCHQKILVGCCQPFHIDLVEVEQRIDNIRPDLVVHSNGQPLLIEIAVTHFVDGVKTSKIERLNMSCIEIDLSDFKEKELLDSEFRKILIELEDRKNWIYHNEESSERIKQKMYLASKHGPDIYFVNRHPDGVKCGYEYPGVLPQLNLNFLE